MESGDNHKQKQPATPSAFTLMKNVRDMCEQPDGRKLLLFTLATYCNQDGICYPGNKTLAAATRKSDRTIRRMLKQLASEGEIDILTPGIGRDQKRIIRLTRYLGKPDKTMSRKPDKAMTGLNRTRSPMKVIAEQPEGTAIEQKERADFDKSAGCSCFVPKVRYPESEAEMYETLERLGIEPDEDHDGNFFEQMKASGWTIRGRPVWDWPAAYEARLGVTTHMYDN